VLLGPQTFSSIAARLAELGVRLMLTETEAAAAGGGGDVTTHNHAAVAVAALDGGANGSSDVDGTVSGHTRVSFAVDQSHARADGSGWAAHGSSWLGRLAPGKAKPKGLRSRSTCEFLLLLVGCMCTAAHGRCADPCM
jgi:hypothetical protein